MDEKVIVLESVNKTFNIDNRLSLSKLLKNNSKKKRFVALEDISFQISKGQMVGIIGHNGSGKTTLLRIIAGIYNADKGKIQTVGRIAPLLHIGIGFRGELNARENILISGMLSGMKKHDIVKKVDQIVEFAELTDFSNMKLNHYSSGMRARLAFSTALQINAEILLVDEILSVGDIQFQEKSFDAFLNFKKQGKTIVYATHQLNQLPSLCDKIILIHHGKILEIGKPDDIIKKYKELSKIK